MKESLRLCIVLPCYNEEKTLRKTISEVEKKLVGLIGEGLISQDSYMLLVDDGSRDSTWSIIAECSSLFPERVSGMRFAANQGKETALWAGCVEAGEEADFVACMDADLQFDINALDDFLKSYYEGYELIYGVKRNRGKEMFLKTIFAAMFYRLMSFLGSPIVKNHTDYCLMSKSVCKALSEYRETHMIFRGLLRKVGFRQKSVEFDVLDRSEGESHFSIKKLISLSVDAITSFSAAPLRLIALVGVLIFIIGILMSVYSLVCFLNSSPPDGYTTLACSMWLLGGLGMLSIGIVGEYAGKIYVEVKRRPRCFVRERTKGRNVWK